MQTNPEMWDLLIVDKIDILVSKKNWNCEQIKQMVAI